MQNSRELKSEKTDILTNTSTTYRSTDEKKHSSATVYIWFSHLKNPKLNAAKYGHVSMQLYDQKGSAIAYDPDRSNYGYISFYPPQTRSEKFNYISSYSIDSDLLSQDPETSLAAWCPYFYAASHPTGGPAHEIFKINNIDTDKIQNFYKVIIEQLADQANYRYQVCCNRSKSFNCSELIAHMILNVGGLRDILENKGYGKVNDIIDRIDYIKKPTGCLYMRHSFYISCVMGSALLGGMSYAIILLNDAIKIQFSDPNIPVNLNSAIQILMVFFLGILFFATLSIIPFHRCAKSLKNQVILTPEDVSTLLHFFSKHAPLNIELQESVITDIEDKQISQESKCSYFYRLYQGLSIWSSDHIGIKSIPANESQDLEAAQPLLSNSTHSEYRHNNFKNSRCTIL